MLTTQGPGPRIVLMFDYNAKSGAVITANHFIRNVATFLTLTNVFNVIYHVPNASAYLFLCSFIQSHSHSLIYSNTKTKARG